MSAEHLVDLVFAEDGLLAKSIVGFESRPQQRAMAETIVDAYQNEKVALVEAGTGTGKSIAYLVPAIYWALRHQEKTVISTHTIALQQQLIEKDLPALIAMMGAEIEAVLVKGMGNYLCLRKLEEENQRNKIFGERDQELIQIEAWASRTKDGTKTDIPFSITPGVWEKVSAEGYSCNGPKCPQYKKCFFFKARRKVEDAQILVVNHHLLFSDLAAKQRGVDKAILPVFSRVVIDEAHHLEEISRDCLSRKCDRIGLIRLLGKLHSEFHPERSRFFQIKERITHPKLIVLLETELPAQKGDLSSAIDEVFKWLEQFCPGDQKRLRQADLAIIEKNISWRGLIEKFRVFNATMAHLMSEMKQLDLQNEILEIASIAQMLQQHLETLSDYPKEGARVRWIEKSSSLHPNIFLYDSPLQVDDVLQEHFFSNLASAILCSATLSTDKHFRFIRSQIGFSEARENQLIEGIFDSPFDYKNRALLLIAKDVPEPTQVGYLDKVTEHVIRAIQVSQGSAFILFTSYEMLDAVYNKVAHKHISARIELMRQGEGSRHALLERFKGKEGNVLFATETFWEGIDVPGEALRCVVITKLPFLVPTNPLLEAKAEQMQQNGRNPFMEYAIPQAVVKFKQGFGRLMRKCSDRGCVLCLDSRLATKPYGKNFLGSLPHLPVVIGEEETLYEEMKSFYRRTGA